MNWDRAKPLRPTELKYDEGKKLDSGIVVTKEKDRLARRAAKAEREWLKKIGKDKI